MTDHPVVARGSQLAELQEYLDRTLQGEGQICFVSGEAGSGKTALVMAFAREAQERHPDLVVALGNCNSQSGIGDPYLPFREILALLTGDEEAVAKRVVTPENASRVKKLLSKSIRVLVEVAPELIGTLIPGGLLAGAIGKAIAEKAGWTKKLEELGKRGALSLQATTGQSRVFEQYTRFLVGVAEDRPIMLVLDDLQWADAASSALLFHLSRRIADRPILIIGTYRPVEVTLGRDGCQHPLEAVLHECKRYHGDIFVALDEVEGPARRELVDAIVDLEPNRLGDSFRETLFEQTSGHPLFTIELLRDMQESGDLTQDPEGRWIASPEMDWDAVPARVEGVIEKRIGRLEPALHEMLSVAGVEGEEFTAQIVARVQKIEDRQALGVLSRELAARHQLVRELGEEAVLAQLVSHYRFTHALFQHYLYEQLGGGERRLLHREIAFALEELYTGQTERIAVQLARHFQEAGVAEKATVYRLAAGQQALEVSAPDEAIAHFREGLELSRALDEPAERAKLQLQLQIGIGSALIPIKGYSAPEVEESFSQARERCRQLGASAELWPVLWGQFYYHLVRGEHSAARGLGEQLLKRLSRLPDDTPLIVAHHTLGTSSYFLGDFDRAIEHLGQGVRLYDAERHHPQALKYGRTDTGAACLSFLALALFTAGLPSQALERADANLDLVRELSHPWSTATALVLIALLHQIRGDERATLAAAEEALSLSDEYGFPFWTAAAKVMRGWALCTQGAGGDGFEQIHQGLDAYQSVGAEASRPQFLAALADAHGRVGRAEQGLVVLQEALATAERTGELHYEAEIHRSRGSLLLMLGADQEAEEEFQRALTVSRRQGAKMFELRAATSLGRLWQGRGEEAEARRLLGEILGRFTEGLETRDLSAARSLLEHDAG